MGYECTRGQQPFPTDRKDIAMASSFKVSSDSLGNVSRDLATGAGDISAQLGTLKSKVDNMAADWEGSGNAAFQALYTQFNDAGGKLQEALNGISQMLGKAATHYDEAETNVAAAFRV